MKSLNLALIFIAFMFGCNKEDSQKKQEKYPECFQSQINSILDGEARNPRSMLNTYSFQESIVYILYTNEIDDELFIVKDNDCNTICEFGGIGAIDTCENWENAEFIETVWEDPR